MTGACSICSRVTGLIRICRTCRRCQAEAQARYRERKADALVSS